MSASKTMAEVWRRLDPEAWDRTNNPLMVLQHAHQDRLREAAHDKELVAQLDDWFERRKAFLASPGWFRESHPTADLTAVAYFSMEFGLSEALPIYSGGLGILAGDHLKSASDLGVPIVGIGLLYQQGYFRQVLGPDGTQLEAFPFNDPGSLPVSPLLDEDGRWPRIRLELPGRTLYLRVWQAVVGRVTLYLLDSNHGLNSPWDRGITANLYAAGREQRLLQELVLGVGGWRIMQLLSLEPEVCHLNEGHAAFAVVARASAFAAHHGLSFEVALRATRAGNVFTTHTPVEAAFDRFDPALVTRYAAPLIAETGLSDREFLALGRRDPADGGEPFNMAYLAMRGSGRANGVARLHGEVSRRLFAPLFPGWPHADVPITHVTNGVHLPTWHSEVARTLWTDASGGDRSWMRQPSVATPGLQRLGAQQLWAYRTEARASLVAYVRERVQRQASRRDAVPADVAQSRHVLDPNLLTLGFARRFAGYKRPDLILHDEERFARLLLDPSRPCQMVVAGKAHPDDAGGKAMVRRLAQFAARADVRSRIVFLEDYDMVLAQHLAAGVDVWINNPRRPLEACGTSGMKMLVNGGLNCSTLDGWWDEAYEPAVGWAIGGTREHDGSGDDDDAEALYGLLEQSIVPEFYTRDDDGIPSAWVERVRASMTGLTERFSSDRMLRDYVEGSYLPAARAYRARADGGAGVALALEQWARDLGASWSTIRFGSLSAHEGTDGVRITVQVFLGDVHESSVRVELVADATEGYPRVVEPLTSTGPLAGIVNGYSYSASVVTDRPVGHFTPRVIPTHVHAIVPLEAPLVTWWAPTDG